jgi:hypothetical protein
MIRNTVSTRFVAKLRTRLRAPLRSSRLFASLTLAVVASTITMASADSRAVQAEPDYHVSFHIISSGGSPHSSGCFRLSNTLGQAVPGYSGGDQFFMFSGFWMPAPASTTMDEIFFDGLQEC